MDLLSLTLRSLDFTSNLSKAEDFLTVPKEESVELDQSKDCLNLFRQSNEHSWRSSQDNTNDLRIITLDEVAWHDTGDDCWVVIYDYVYDCTEFLEEHPGGSDVLLEYAGRDATLAFIGTGHSRLAKQSLERYLIGELPAGERIFRIPDGVKLAGLSMD